MASYKVIQDIEAEDKLVGPLGFRQFVYFLIAAFLGYLSFISVAKGAPFLLVLFVPPMLFCLFFAWPWTPDQPTEVWALAHIRFYVKSRKRVWNQSGIKDFVTITVPKKIERTYSDGLSQTEVRSRLQALAHTIDSRGWAIKNASMSPGASIVMPQSTDRLLDFSAMPQEVSNLDITDSDDILDAVNNPAAYHMTEMIDASAKARREDLLQRLRDQGASIPAQPASAAAPQWFKRTQQATAIDQAGSQNLATSLPAVAQSTPSVDTTQLPAARPSSNEHLKTVAPLTQPVAQPQPLQPVIQEPAAAAPTATTNSPSQPTATQPDPAILNLAHDNNLDVATLAREAKKARGLDASDGEVVISLH